MKKMIFFVLVLCLSVSGCSFKDIDKRFFVVAIGVDKGKKQKFLVTLKLAIPAPLGTKSGENESVMIRQEMNSISEAIRLLKTEVDKELDFGHAKVILFGEGLAKQDMTEALDWFVRRRDIQGIAWVSIASPSAEKIIQIQPKWERFASNALYLSFGQSGVESSYIITEFLYDFYARYHEKGLSAYLPVIKAREDHYVINQASIFRNKKVKLELSKEETQLLNVTMRSFNKFDLKVKTKQGELYISVEGVSNRYTIDTTSSPPTIHFNVELNGILEEEVHKIGAAEKIKKYEAIAAQEYAKKLKAFLQKLQKANVDPYGFGLRYRATHFNNKNEWAEWEKIYPRAQFKVDVKVKIAATGLVE
ncbi:Ger(x)C family spore germination protein [Brevibacillus sp. B_LB10_24]|uniref:Ger(x)C family spore germination protein n=1 Tax=Brevibacillus sp. B_LB10_24 TaxID=3380645 RepID=UPI0038B805A8